MYLRVRSKSQETSKGFIKGLVNVGKLLFVRSMSVDVRDLMSETQWQRLNVRDSMAET